MRLPTIKLSKHRLSQAWALEKTILPQVYINWYSYKHDIAHLSHFVYIVSCVVSRQLMAQYTICSVHEDTLGYFAN